MATNSLTDVAGQLLPSTMSADPSDAFPRKFVGLEGLQAHEVHDDSWVGVYTVVMHCSSLLSTLLAALTFHTIFNKSTPSMAMYRLYLLNCLCWGYFYSVVLGQIQPVFLAPLVAAYLRSTTLPKIFDSSEADFQWLILSEVCFLNYVLGLLLLLLYRFVFFSSSDSSLLARAMGSTSTLVVLMTTNTLLNLTIINLVVGYLQGDQDQFLCKLDEAFPQLSSLFVSHRLIGYSRLGDFKFFLAVAETLCVLMITLLALTNWMLHRKKPKISHGTNNSKTTRLMTQLYHMNTVQIALIAIILLCPMVVGVTLSAYRSNLGIWNISMNQMLLILCN